MKLISSELRSHLDGEVTTLCRCWVIERTDGVKLGFTDHDETLLVNGVPCERQSGMETSSIEEQRGLNVDSAEISGALSSDTITDEDINSGKYDHAKIHTYLVNWTEPSQFVLDRVMLVGEIIQEDGAYRIEMRGLSSVLDQTQGRHFIKHCQADLGDDRCKVIVSGSQYSTTGHVTAVLTSGEFRGVLAGSETFENGWFDHGKLTWSTGDNSEVTAILSSHKSVNSEAELVLWKPMYNEIQPGDQFSLTAGCDKQFATCKAKFSNTINFQGYPHLPGDGFATSHVANSNIFDGKALVE